MLAFTVADDECTANQDCYTDYGEGYCCGTVECTYGSGRTATTTTYTDVCYDASSLTDDSDTITYDSTDDCTQVCVDYDTLSAATDDDDDSDTSSATLDLGEVCTTSSECLDNDNGVCCGSLAYTYPDDYSYEEVEDDSDEEVEVTYLCVSEDYATTLEEALGDGWTVDYVCDADSSNATLLRVLLPFAFFTLFT